MTRFAVVMAVTCWVLVAIFAGVSLAAPGAINAVLGIGVGAVITTGMAVACGLEDRAERREQRRQPSSERWYQ